MEDANPVRAVTASVESLGNLIRTNADEAVNLMHNLATWTYLREVLQGAAPPIRVLLEIPFAGRDEPVLVPCELGTMEAADVEAILFPMCRLFGRAVIEGTRDQFNTVGMMNQITEDLVAQQQAEQQPEQEEPQPEESPAPVPAASRPLQSGRGRPGQVDG